MTSDRQKYRIKNWDKIRDREREWNKTYYYRVRSEIFNILRNKCAKCGIADLRILQIDHISGGGNSRKIIGRGGQGARKKILNELQSGSKDYQLLCANCNIIKKHENGEIKGHLRKEFYNQKWSELSKRKTTHW